MILFDNRILYQNSDCLVVNKLKGESAQGGKDGIVNLPKELKLFLNTDFVQAVHRIDVPVTGCVLFALTNKALVFLNNAFSGEGAVPIGKKYWAIAEKPSLLLSDNTEQLSERELPTRGELVHWIEINAGKNKSFAYNEDSPGRKKAALRYNITGEGKNYLFMEIELLSGRHHQIRAQLAAAGLHIKGDIKYGAKRSEKDGGIRLHARFLSFPNPLKKTERIGVTADPPVLDNLWTEFIKNV